MNYFYFCCPFEDQLKKEHNIGIIIKAFMLACGLLAVSIYSSNDLLQDKIEDNFPGVEYNEESENTAKDSQQTIFLPDYLASIFSFQINVDLVKTVLFDIPFLTEIKNWGENIPEYQITSYFKVLFKYIIGPNAP